MASKGLKAIDEAKNCIKNNQNFIFQGGAGSGKTESLKELLEYISEEFPEKKVICITYTNKAVEEIQSRVNNNKYSVSTIHSFLNSFIKDYKKNIHSVIYELFKLEQIAVENHADYKKFYKKYSDKLFTVKNEKCDQVIGKKEYDKNPQNYNSDLNSSIETLNNEILGIIESKDYNQIVYNETRFNNFNDLTFGHDGLLEIAYRLFEKYPLLKKILHDKCDCIFIDEYQDAKKEVIDFFLNLPNQDKIVIGLFGDSMQSIYSDGTGFINNESLKRINKEDNYRCSQQVVDFINIIRTDGLSQEVALKTLQNGEKETIKDREGEVKFYYSIIDQKPHSRSEETEKQQYLDKLDNLINEIDKDNNFTKLKLTNKSIASDAGYGNLYEIFNDRYTETNEELERHLIWLQFDTLCELCNAFENKQYNQVLSHLKKNGLAIKKLSDKEEIIKNFTKIITGNLGAFDAIEQAFLSKLLKKSEKYGEYINRKEEFLLSIKNDEKYQAFKNLYLEGNNTFLRIKDKIDSEIFNEFDETDFDELKAKYKKEDFYFRLFSNELKFKEICSYYKYQREETPFITMHKTKGTGIDNVLVILDEYFWQEYDFKTIYIDDADDDKKQKNTNLFYVACSRAKKNLICIKLIKQEEEEGLKKKFGSFCKNADKQQNGSIKNV